MWWETAAFPLVKMKAMSELDSLTEVVVASDPIGHQDSEVESDSGYLSDYSANEPNALFVCNCNRVQTFLSPWAC